MQAEIEKAEAAGAVATLQEEMGRRSFEEARSVARTCLDRI
jgi:hypothetical protein